MPSYVVTGANRGIGLEFVRQLSAKPENVVIGLVRNLSTTDALKGLGRSNVHIVHGDIADYKTIKAAAAETAKITGGSLDMLINNAAMLPGIERSAITLDGYPEGHEQELEDDLVAMFRVNVVGVIHTINAFLPLIKKGSLKKVIALSSGAGDLDLTISSGYEAAGAYAISKAALNLAIAKYAAEYKSEGILFLSISPGVVDTIDHQLTPKEAELFGEMIVRFKAAAPNWERPLTTEESVTAMFKVIDALTPEKSGEFLSHKGNKDWL